MRKRCSENSTLQVQLIGLWVLLALTAPIAARADAATTGEPPAYKATIANAIEEFEHDNFTEAREQFERAHAMFPNARTLRGLGITAFELRNYVEAVNLLDQALGSEIKRLDGQLRTETERLLERARKYVGEVRLRVAPASATLIVDGVSSDAASRGSLILGVGDHVLEFRANGHLSERRAIRVKGEQVQTLAVQLTAPTEATPIAAEPQQQLSPNSSADRGERTPVYKRWWLWTAVGVVVAGAAVGTALWLRADSAPKVHPITTDNTPAGLHLQPLRLP